MTIAPRPTPPPPVWVSGRSAAAQRRAARLGDGWLPYMYTPEQLAASAEAIAAERERAEPVRTGLFILGSVAEDGAAARRDAVAALSRTYAQDFERLVDRYAFAGTPDAVAARLREYVDAGADTIVVSFACPARSVDATRALFTREVLPHLRG